MPAACLLNHHLTTNQAGVRRSWCGLVALRPLAENPLCRLLPAFLLASRRLQQVCGGAGCGGAAHAQQRQHHRHRHLLWRRAAQAARVRQRPLLAQREPAGALLALSAAGQRMNESAAAAGITLQLQLAAAGAVHTLSPAG